MNTKMTKAELMDELKTAQQRIAELERVSVQVGGDALFSRVFQVSPSLMALTEIGSGKYVEANEAFLNTLGFTREEVIGKTAAELNLFVDPGQRSVLLERLQQQGYLRDEFVLVRSKAGKILYGVFAGEFVHVREQKFVLLAMNDVTSLEKARHELKETHDRLLEAQQLAHIGNWEWDLQQHLTWSEGVYRIFGVSSADFSPSAETFISFLHPEDKEDFLRQSAIMLEKKHFTNITYRIILPLSGEVRYVHERAQLIVDEHGTATRVIGTVQDVTEQKLAEASLRKSEELLSEAQQIGRIGHWEWTAPGRDLLCSDEFFNILQIPKNGNVISQLTLSSMVDSEDRLQLAQWDRSAFASQSDLNYEFRIRLADGQVRWLHQQAKVTYGEGGQPLRMMGAVQDITERKQVELALQASETNYRKLAETSDSAIAVLDRDGWILYANPVSLHVWEEPQLVGKMIYEIFNKEIADGYIAVIRRVIDEQITDTNELEVTIKGRRMWFHVNLSPLKNSDGSADTLLLNAMDITERKLTEDSLKESEHVLRLFVEHSPASIAMFDRDMKYIVASRRYLMDYRLGEQDLTGRSHYEVFPEINDDFKQIHQRCLKGAIEGAEATPFLRMDGTTDWVHWEIHPWYEESGRVGGIILFSEVITERIAAQEQLRESEEKYRILINSTSDGVFVAQDERFVFCNSSLPAMLGYTFEEFIDMPFEKVIAPEHLEVWASRFRQRIAGENIVSNYQALLFDKTGAKKIWIELRANLINYGGQPAVLGITRDITDQKRILEQIESLAKFPAENPGPILRVDLSGKLLYANEASRALLTEWSLDVGKPVPETVLDVAANVLETGCSKTIETMHKDRVITLDFILLQQGGYINVYGKDITEQRRAEKDVRALQEFSQSTIDALSSHLCVLDETGVILSVNAAWRAFGDANPPILPNYGVGENYLAVCDNANGDYSNDAHQVAAGLRTVLSGELTEYHLEYACHSPDEQRWFYLRAQRFESHGSPRLVISHENITDRRLAVEALRHSELKYRSLYENLRDGFAEVTLDGAILEYNEAYRNMLGYSDAELKKMSFMDITPEKWHIFEEEIIKTQVLTRGYSDVYEKEYRNKDGVIFPIEVRAHLTRDETGRPSSMWGVVRDITYRKVIEHELIRINERFTELAEHVSDIFWISEPQTHTNLYISPAFTTIMGRSKEEVAQLLNGYLDIVVPEDQPIVIHKRELEASGFKTNVQYRIRRPDESIRWIRDKGTPVFDSEGGVIRVVGIASDITEQVEAAVRISESEKRFQQIAETIPEMFWMFDNVKKNLMYVSPAYEAIWGRPVQSLYENNDIYLEAIFPEDRAVVLAALQRQANGEESEMEYRLVQPNGSIRWVHDRSFPIFDEKTGSLIRTTGIVTDVTERKQTEAALHEGEERLRLSISASKQGLYDLNLQTGEAIVNREYAEMLGYDPETFVETNQVWIERLHPDDAEITSRIYENYINGLIPEYRVEFRQRTKDGGWKWFLSLGKIVEYDADGKPTRMLGTHTDINEQKQAELDLQKRASHLALINDVGRQITSFLDFQAAMDTFPRLVQEAFGYHHIGLFTLDKDSNQLLMVSKAGEYARLFPQGHRIQLGEGVVGSVGLSGEMKLVNQVYDDPLYIPTVIPTQSELSLPIKIAEEVVGVLDVQSPLPHAFTDEDIKVLSTLVDQMAVVIENAYLYEAVQKELAERKRVEGERQTLIYDLGERVKELTVLHQAARLFQNTALSEQQTLQALVEIMPPAWRYSEITVARITVDDKEYSTPGFIETPWMQKTVVKLPGDRHAVIEVAYLEERPVKDDGPFSQEEQQLIETLAEKMQSALTRQSMERDLRKRTEDLSNLLEAGRALSETLDPDRIYPLVYQYIADVMPCDFLVLSSFDPQTEMIKCEYIHSIEGPQDVSGFPPLPLEPPGRGTQSLAIRSGESLLLPDYDQALSTATHHMQFNEKAEILEENLKDPERVRSAIIVPLKVNGVVAGALQVFSSRLNAHTPDHLHFVEALAFHISAALSNARLFSELEERVQQRTAEVQDLYENAPTGYHSLNSEGQLVNINQTELNWLGYIREEVIGRSFTDFITPETIHIFIETFPIFKQRGWMNNVEVDLLRKDGASFPVLINATAVRNEAGDFLMSRSTVFDNTERKQADLALRESDEQNRLLFEDSPDAVVLFDQNSRVIRINHAFETITGRYGKQFIGHLLTEIGILPRQLIEALSVTAQEALEQDGKLAVLEFKMEHTSGEMRDVSARVFTLNLHGEPHYLASMHDITTSKRAEETLRLANTEMERALRLKDEFLANMSHELRTPLNAILGITESLLEQISGSLNEKQQKYLQTVSESAQHLLVLINDILDLAKVNAGRIDLEINKADIVSVSHASLRMVRELAQKKGVAVELKIDAGIKLAWVDERRLKQMLVNLLSNAVKFTPQDGSIGLEVRSDALANILHFTVWDTGIGINQHDLRLLFQPFVQLDAGLARGSQGTGLGLVLVSQMARLHGGSVSVESEPGKGSRFTISLPWVVAGGSERLVRREHPLKTSQVKAPIHHAKDGNPIILIVEDTEAVTMLISDYLIQHGYQVIVARDGYEGLARCAETSPDLILMDVMMPELDGFETTRRIRTKPELANVPIIALTALAMAGDRERCLAAGMNDYLSKPVKLKELLDAIERQLTAHSGGPE